MACDCQSYQCLEAKFNPCSEGAELALVSTETGTWSAEIEFNGVLTDFDFGVTEGENIIIPTEFLNENYLHRIKFYDGTGELVNNTCYNLKARATSNAGTYSPIPPDTLAQILEDIAELQADVVVIDTELTSIQSEIDDINQELIDHEFDVTVSATGVSLSDSRLLNKNLSTISMGGQDYNSTFWDKPIGSNTVTSKNDPEGNPWITFVAGQTVTLTLDL